MYPILTIQRTRVTHLLIGMQLLMVYILLKAKMPMKIRLLLWLCSINGAE
jgi:hypothetical protein